MENDDLNHWNRNIVGPVENIYDKMRLIWEELEK